MGPQAALLQVTRFCNLTCTHCSQSAPRLHNTADLMELSTEAWIAIMRNLREIGVERVRFTGGEPFLRPDIETLCRAALHLGIEPSFVTNALTIFPRHGGWLHEIRPKVVWISLYGYPDSIYDEVAGRPGLYARCVRAIVNLLEASIPVGLYYPLGEHNAEAVGGFLRRSYRLGVRRAKIMQVLPLGRASNGQGLGPPSRTCIESALGDIVDAVRSLPGLTVKVAMDTSQTSMFRAKGFRVPEKRGCYAGLDTLWTVDSEGKALGCCLFLGGTAANLLDARSLEKCLSWGLWNRQRTLQRLGVHEEPPKSCPALARGSDVGDGNDFVCPLTYAVAPIA